ncbi:hypothetical protein [Paracoccus yeei]|uniref:hypothetical protein n=1 Tax=Paracoccus yeei TaxID=147645 RepID=UPI003BF8233D
MKNTTPSLRTLAPTVSAPVANAAMEETRVMRAYREWQAALNAWKEASQGEISDEEGDAWCSKVSKLADDVLDQPSTGPLDFVYKLMAQSFHGLHDIGACPRGDELWAEARTLVEEAA